MDEHSHDHRRHRIPRVSRRRLLQAGGALAVGATAGCLGGNGGGEVPAAVALSGGLECDVCGMVIEKHPGPDGQLFFEANEPEGHGPPARFDSLKQCLFPYLLERRARGWTESAVYVTDYSTVEYTVSTEGDTRVVSSHPEAAAFGDATTLHFVVGSSIEGAMGPDFVPFSVRGDADEFAAEYGGDVVGFDDIDEAVVGR
jgi:nitrous oxide reductase accessory protein NosL